MSNILKKYPTVILFGRTNVGKSTLFNCLTEKKKALVSSVAGTTRDSKHDIISWRRKKFELIDTGGIIDPRLLINKKTTDNSIDVEVQKKAVQILKKADLILFLVDARVGLLPQDRQMVLFLKKINTKKTPLLLIANKADSPKIRTDIAEFNKLGLNEPLAISATSGSGTGDLLDQVVKLLPKQNKAFAKKNPGLQKNIKVSLIGKPNVGKSSLINSLIGEKKFIVSSIPHTTREPNDLQINHNGTIFTFIDTAGISKRGQRNSKSKKIMRSLEKQSIAKSLTSLKYADIALLIIDINGELTHQDAKLVEEIIKLKKSIIIVANKWDLVKERNTKIYTAKIYAHFPFITWAPIQFVSALTGEKVTRLFPLIEKIFDARSTVVQANPLSKLLNKLVKKHRPAKAKGTKHPRIYELKQEENEPPVFSVRIGPKDTIHLSYLRFIENQLRKKFGFIGTPITMFVKKNKHVHGQHQEEI